MRLDNGTVANVPPLAASLPILLVGVMSYASPVALERRERMRKLHSSCSDERSMLRFVLGARDADSERGDVWTFGVSRNDRKVGTFLLTAAFFRRAMALPQRVSFIARADDDSAFNASALAEEMLWLQRAHPLLVYGPYGEWFNWNETGDRPACWARSYHRWVEANKRPNVSSSCVGSGLKGPFPFAKGPLVAYSRSVVEGLLPRLAAAAMERVAAKRAGKKTPLYDDVYFGYLLYDVFGGRRVGLVDMPISEFVKERAPESKLRPAAVLHVLKTPQRFDYVLNRSSILLRRTWPRKLKCKSVSGVRALALRSARQWQHCAYTGWRHVDDRKQAVLRNRRANATALRERARKG